MAKKLLQALQNNKKVHLNNFEKLSGKKSYKLQENSEVYNIYLIYFINRQHEFEES